MTELSEAKKNELIRKVTSEALRFYLDFDPKFMNMVECFAHDLQVKPSFVIERMALAHYAEMAAEEELAGQPLPKALMEFAPGMDAEQFYDYWKSSKVKQANADLDLAGRMTELNKYLLPGERAGSVYPSELQRRKDRAELIKQFPDKKDVFERADARQEEKRKQNKL
jgi:hypothetical protein